MNKVLFWLLTFSLLSGYTFTVLRDGVGGVSYAYAKAIENNPSSQSSIYIEVTKSPLQESVFKSAIARLQATVNKEKELCEISEDDLVKLQKQGVLTETLNKNGAKVFSPQTSISHTELQKQFPNIHCLQVPIFERVILNLTAHIS